jgi:predicted RNase H-like HicB family nuclease
VNGAYIPQVYVAARRDDSLWIVCFEDSGDIVARAYTRADAARMADSWNQTGRIEF